VKDVKISENGVFLAIFDNNNIINRVEYMNDKILNNNSVV
jgi:hypothetical protein